MVNLEVNVRGAVPVVRLAGELVGSDAPDVLEAIHEHVAGQGARLAVDLSELKLIDSTGLGMLINVVTRARLSGGRVILVSPTPFVAGILNVSRLDQWFEITPNLPEAVRHLSAE